MGGCCVVVLMMFLIPIALLVLFLLLGTIGASLIGIVISTVLLIIGSKKGLFAKYSVSEVKWQRIAAKVIKIVLIILLAVSVTGLIGGSVLLMKFWK